MFSRNILFHKFYFTNNIVKCTCYFDTEIQKKENVLKEMEFKPKHPVCDSSNPPIYHKLVRMEIHLVGGPQQL